MNAIFKPTPAPHPVADFVDADDHINNQSANPHFDNVLQARMLRRSVFKGALGTGAAAIFGSLATVACGGSDNPAVAAPPPAPPAAPAQKPLGFSAVAKNLIDTVTVATGYTSTTLYRTGDPIAAGLAAYKNDGTDTDMDKRSGDCHDGIEYFGLNAAGTARDPQGSTRGLLAMNHEYMTPLWLHPNGPTRDAAGIRPKAEVDKETAVHGCAVIEVKLTNGKWEYPVDSAYNRRITPTTTMELSGPLRGNAAMKTVFSTAGTQTRGTQNNCGTGYSYWGTFLTCEENWAGYFFRAAGDDAKRSAKEITSINRYGRRKAFNTAVPPVEINVASRYGWESDRTGDLYQRWDMSSVGASTDGSDDYRNIANTFGFVVEIDPYDKTAPIKKRTAMGRFAHEAAVMPKLVQGKAVAVYMGDDSQNEYIYKYVSSATWNAADGNASNRMAIGDKYLDAGTLYVAKFNADGTGQWLAVSIANPLISGYATYAFADQADVLLNTRLAADALGATKMDRPEWGAVNPKNNDVYMTLTNNSSRTAALTDAANPRAYSDVQGSRTNTGNVNGHIIRFSETGGEPAATSFNWDVYLFGAESGADGAAVNLSGLTADNDFSSPDGLWFSEATGFSWVQTDDGNYTDVTNCMLLAGIPGARGDGAKTTVNYPAVAATATTAAVAAKAVDTYVGKKPTATELKRFLVGPNDCEITGITETPDGKAIFVNIQHPGENTTLANLADNTKWTSYWPDAVKGAAGAVPKRPRSATIVVTKNDGGQVGFG
jgi:uncharacterized protein